MGKLMKKGRSKTVAIVYGGKSGEHEVSCRSAEFVNESLLNAGYKTVMVKFGKDGLFSMDEIVRSNVVFPVIHGTYGEDGCLQGLLEMYDKPYVGAGVLGSAIGMDKDVQKRLLREAGIEIANYQVVRKSDKIDFGRVQYPVFVKPANLGSSVGISRCEDKDALVEGVGLAFRFDNKVLLEEAVVGREIEVAMLGDDDAGFEVRASVPGEVVPIGKHTFYDYEAKYIDENGARLMIPMAGVNPRLLRRIQDLATKTFSVLECRGIARVDMFMKPDGGLVVNEINTLPGFTNISMYPKLWAESGVNAVELMILLIDMALARGRIKSGLQRTYQR